MTKNIWGTLPATNRTPHAALREQATLLSNLTNGLLVGRVKRRSTLPKNPSGSETQGFELKLLIVAPALDNYSYAVATIFYPIATLYPATVKDDNKDDKPVICHSEEELMQALETIVSSDRTRRVISSLLGEIRAEMPDE